MKRNISLAIASFLIASPAFAGSLAPVYTEPTPMVPAPMPMMTPAWAGGYVGANLNYGEGTLGATGDAGDILSGLDLSSTLSEPDGWGGSVRAGYDWQMGQGVFGLGVEYNFGELTGDIAGAGAEELGVAGGDIVVDEMATVFARAGYAVSDQFLAYGLLGYSRASSTITDAAGGSLSSDLDGYTAGLGGEYKFTQNWSTYAEYTYTDFGTISGTDSARELDLHQVRLGVNYRF